MQPGESSATIRQRVVNARNIQLKRYKGFPDIYCNAHMPEEHLNNFCNIETHARRFLLKNINLLQLSVRSYSKIMKVSRTIADLAGSNDIELPHIGEAIHFRNLDKPLIFPYAKRSLNKRSRAKVSADYITELLSGK